MADLTDSDKAAFVGDVITALKTNKDRLTAKDWDPTSRITNLTNGQAAITAAQEVLDAANTAQEAAQKAWRQAFDTNYDLASSSVSSIEGALGKNDSAVTDLRGSRGAMHHASSKKTSAKTS